MLRRAAILNGFDGLHVTKLDVLDGLAEIKIAVAHEIAETGKERKRVTEFPIGSRDAAKAKPVYETLKGFKGTNWKKVVGDGEKKGFDALPPAALAYVRKIEELSGTPVLSVSVGERREDIVFAVP